MAVDDDTHNGTVSTDWFIFFIQNSYKIEGKGL